MERLMGLDVGDKTIGVAVSDLLMITAQGVKTIKRTSIKNDINELKKIIDEYKVTKIVAGVPKMLDGSIGIQGEKVLNFLEKLRKHIDLPIELEDERFTTTISERMLIEADVRRKKRKEVIDKLAAVQILSSYMQRIK
ncbi:MAG TPA: Holliday junction resolvase RuvX [Sedimentibacter sp.]|jgi:putative Holliday junction resolvase|nr:Holliday junction resolvase RuvX [Sedimentibacter sp.]HHZ00365.1 Holliday junction resolvase RuvX [Tissierellia bacterium]HOK48692.1 Holliday junction resolvase RuvX [Sedimentibacter sp.]HOW23302.1 Holliday junction resolvase RuvX [Sedimentibacter sp.]HRC81126.1 Holliday junction resolvase RuvX [Sedimentibacter sp.]